MSENIDNERGQTFTAQRPMTDTPDAKLLPCPFCGGEAGITLKHPLHLWYELACHNHECPFRPKITFATSEKETAIARWNTRPQPAPPSQAAVKVVATIPGYGGHGYPGPYPGTQPAPPAGELELGLASMEARSPSDASPQICSSSADARATATIEECLLSRLETELRYSGLIDPTEPPLAIRLVAQDILKAISPYLFRPNLDQAQ